MKMISKEGLKYGYIGTKQAYNYFFFKWKFWYSKDVHTHIDSATDSDWIGCRKVS